MAYIEHTRRAPYGLSAERDSSLDDLREALLDRLESLAETLLGAPSLKHGRQWRFGNKGSLALELHGRKRGVWHSHEAGTGGGPFQLIQHARGCGFVEALAWAKSWLGIGDAPAPAIDTAALIERARKQAAVEAEEAASVASRIATARRLWTASIAIDGTTAERYLTETRCIPRPAAGWPDAVRFHEPSSALILAATNDAGDVMAVQRVRLTLDAKKIAGTDALPAKQTNGVLAAGAVVRLPGDAAGPLLFAEGPETGLSAWVSAKHETWLALGSVASVTPPDGRRVIVCRDDDADDSPASKRLAEAIEGWQAEGADVLVATPWPERRGDKSDFNDTIKAGGVEAVLARIAAAVAPGVADTAADMPAGPHYPRPHLAGDAASLRLRKVIAAWFSRVERHLEARDFIAAEAERLLPEARQASEARILAKLIRADIDPEEAEEMAATRSAKAAPRLARSAARKAARERFGQRAASGVVPRIQIKGAAGLGKTQAIIAEYLSRPALWTRNIAVYTRDLDLSDAFAADVKRAAGGVATAPDGSRPHVIVIRGRQSEGMCGTERRKVVNAAQEAGCDSIYRTCCHTPAVGKLPESFCEIYDWCKEKAYLAQFMDTKPALRVMAHARLALPQPDEIRLPTPDLVIVDESAIGALAEHAEVDPALLSDFATYASEPGEEHLIQEAVDTGRTVEGAVAGGGDAVAALVAAGIEPKHLRAAAKAAALAAALARPVVYAGLNPEIAKERLHRHKPHHGRAVAAVMAQLARDIEAKRTASVGIEWDAKHTATMENGQKVVHPIIRRHGLAHAFGAPGKVALLLLDADASLCINRRLFGADLRGFTVPAVRQAYVIQVSDHALAKSSLVHNEKLPNNMGKAAKLRGRIAEMVRRETAGGKKVLVIAALAVRRALTGETEDKVPVSVKWQGAVLTHYGRHLGANAWRDFDTVIILGREQLPPIEAERMARAIYANAPGVTLELPGNYGRELRRHDLRNGTAPAVSVQAHIDSKVQEIAEISRECAMGQGADRLRLIHRNPQHPARVVVVSNLPVPGLVVDRLMTLDDVLDGGTAIERALARMPGGVLPLSPDWLAGNMRDLFGSPRTAARAVADLRMPSGNIEPYCHLAFFRTAGQRCPSKALVRPDATDPRAEIARLLSADVVEFRMDSTEPALAELSALPVWPDADSAENDGLPPAILLPLAPPLALMGVELLLRLPSGNRIEVRGVDGWAGLHISGADGQPRERLRTAQLFVLGVSPPWPLDLDPSLPPATAVSPPAHRLDNLGSRINAEWVPMPWGDDPDAVRAQWDRERLAARRPAMSDPVHLTGTVNSRSMIRRA